MSGIAKPTNIVLGKGVFLIDNIPLGLTRDGGNFSVEYAYREIHADGDKGSVKDRIAKDEARPKLQVNHLEVLTSLAKLHPGIEENKSDGQTKITGADLSTNDYHDVSFKGETKDGREIVITVKNAFNKENINWALKEKDEIIDNVTFEGCYEEGSNVEPWEIIYPEAA